MSTPAPSRKAPSAAAIILHGLRARHGQSYSLAQWARAHSLEYGTVWASVTRWACRDSLPTGRTAYSILTQLCADLPDATLRQLRTPAARAALAARAAASDQAA
jgi:hypothetical protein